MVNFFSSKSYSKSYLEGANSSSLWEGLPLSLHSKKLFIKPNLVVPQTKWEQGSLTHVGVVSLVIEQLKDRGCSDITLGDCGFKDQWEYTIASSGYDQLPKKYGVKLIGLQEGANFHKFSLIRFKEQKEYLSLFGAKVSDYVLESDGVINLPKLKVHKMALVTGAIKNMMGVIAQKGSMHPKANIYILHKRLRDLYFLLRDRVIFCVMDGIVGSEYSEHYGLPVKVGLLFSSKDMWEMDCIAAQIMGISPSEVPYLKNIQKTQKGVYPILEGVTPVNFERPLGWSYSGDKKRY